MARSANTDAGTGAGDHQGVSSENKKVSWAVTESKSVNNHKSSYSSSANTSNKALLPLVPGIVRVLEYLLTLNFEIRVCETSVAKLETAAEGFRGSRQPDQGSAVSNANSIVTRTRQSSSIETNVLSLLIDEQTQSPGEGVLAGTTNDANAGNAFADLFAENDRANGHAGDFSLHK